MGEQQRRKELATASKQPNDSDRKLWVIAVLAFWVSAGVTLVVMFTTEKLNLILVSITLGMMVLGIWLKVRYQLQHRKSRNSQASGSDST